METRLTLTIDERMVNVAKAHARTQGKTLSQLVAEYFQALSKHGASRSPQTPILYYKVRQVLHTAPVLENIIDLSLKSKHRDFEDAIQYYSAMDVKCEYFVTRNKKDFPPNSMQIVTPEEFLAIFQS